jgi:predicted dehydrogenase
VPQNRLRVGIVGCGDVLHRHYLAPLIARAARAEVVGCCDARLAAAELAVAAVRGSSPKAAAFGRLGEMLETVAPDAVLNFTPAPLHAEVTAECLAAGAHVFSEKPIAASIVEADRLIAQAHEAGLLLLCATASALTAQIRWLRKIVDSGRLGRPTLAVAQVASMGPADWFEYTGDPAVFYGSSVGPVRDIGVYRLHELTALLGPVRRVGAMGTIAIPERKIVAGPRAGQTVSVTAPDHVLIHLEFASGALGQLLCSFAAPGTQAPRLELHLTGGSISLVGDQFDPIPASVFVRDEVPASGAGAPTVRGLPSTAGWHHGVATPPPPDEFPTIGLGVGHFLACVAGDERPVLTAEHARHVLEIILAAYESMADGRVRDLATTF